MNFRERLEQSRERQGSNTEALLEVEMEDGYSCEYFAIDNIKSLPACLDLRLPNGSRKALPYNYFVEIDFLSGNIIEITTTTKKVQITGRDLGKLYDYLVSYRVRYITSNLGADLKDEGLFVGEILIKDFD